jgi:hypothetical protein
MEEIAWRLRSTTTKPSQSLGFVSATQLQEIESEESEDTEISPAANVPAPTTE